MLLKVADDDAKVWRREYHGGQTREQDRNAIEPLNTQAGSRIGSVGSGKTCTE